MPEQGLHVRRAACPWIRQTSNGLNNSVSDSNTPANPLGYGDRYYSCFPYIVQHSSEFGEDGDLRWLGPMACSCPNDACVGCKYHMRNKIGFRGKRDSG